MFTKALDLQPDNIPSLFHLGMMQHKNGDLKESLHSFSEVLDAIGDDRLVLHNLLYYFLSSNNNKSINKLKRHMRAEDWFIKK